MSYRDSHYYWLEQNLQTFFSRLGIKEENGIISAHGDKCYSYQDKWEKAGIPFPHGVAIYLLSYLRPYDTEVRETKNGWVKVEDWVIVNYPKFKPHLPSV